MHFSNIDTHLEIIDDLEKEYVTLKLTFSKTFASLEEFKDKYFAQQKVRLQETSSFVTQKVELSDKGKSLIKNIISELKSMDQHFMNRLNVVEDFKNLLK